MHTIHQRARGDGAQSPNICESRRRHLALSGVITSGRPSGSFSRFPGNRDLRQAPGRSCSVPRPRADAPAGPTLTGAVAPPDAFGASRPPRRPPCGLLLLPGLIDPAVPPSTGLPRSRRVGLPAALRRATKRAELPTLGREQSFEDHSSERRLTPQSEPKAAIRLTAHQRGTAPQSGRSAAAVHFSKADINAGDVPPVNHRSRTDRPPTPSDGCL
jgi:hypothetical protein